MDEELVADDIGAVDNVGAFGNDRLPGLRGNTGHGLEDASVGCLVVGADVPLAVGVHGREARFEAPYEDVEGCAGLAQVAENDIYALGWYATADGYDQIVSVVGDARADQVHLT